MKMSYKTTDTCCKEIIFEINENKIIEEVQFIGGCPGNLLGMKKLVEGETVESVINKCSGITCGSKSTSCPDQLSNALKEFLLQLDKAI
jgi:uncharacterized protein (TIGR03905 family)